MISKLYFLLLEMCRIEWHYAFTYFVETDRVMEIENELHLFSRACNLRISIITVAASHWKIQIVCIYYSQRNYSHNITLSSFQQTPRFLRLCTFLIKCFIWHIQHTILNKCLNVCIYVFCLEWFSSSTDCLVFWVRNFHKHSKPWVYVYEVPDLDSKYLLNTCK